MAGLLTTFLQNDLGLRLKNHMQQYSSSCLVIVLPLRKLASTEIIRHYLNNYFPSILQL